MIKRTARFLANWKNVITYAVAVLITMMLIAQVDNVISRRESRMAAIEATKANQLAIASAEASRDRASRRIDSLLGENSRLIDQLNAANDAQARLAGQVEALAGQVHQLGGRPVVTPTTIKPVMPTVTTIAPLPPPITAAPSSTTVAPNRPNATTTTTRRSVAPQQTTTTTRPRSTTPTTTRRAS